jgi:16S rRNA (uracil1498-N3)-methyltransferase
MRISRVYTATSLASGATVTLQGNTAHYLGKVLRLTTGNALVLFNGDGREYPATIDTVSKNAVTATLGEARTPDTESALRTVLGIGISRGERMDYVVQKSTELGVSEIVPLFTEHCEVKLNAERQEKRVEHWQQVAISACEQCGRVVVPTILPPVKLTEWIQAPGAGLKLLCDQGESQVLSGPAPDQGESQVLSGPAPDHGVALLVGPEGGLSATEMTQAKAAGFEGVSFGKRILRTETAPVTALSVLQYLWG